MSETDWLDIIDRCIGIEMACRTLAGAAEILFFISLIKQACWANYMRAVS